MFRYRFAAGATGATCGGTGTGIPKQQSQSYTTQTQLPEEHKMVYEMCRSFADAELAPYAGEWDKKHEFPKEAVSKLVSRVRCCPCLDLVFINSYDDVDDLSLG